MITSMLKRNVHILNFQVIKYMFLLMISFREYNPIHCLFIMNMYIEFWALKLRCTQYGFCGVGSLEECKNNYSWSQISIILWSGSRKVLMGLPEGLWVTGPSPYHIKSPFLRKHVRGCFSVQHRTYACQDISKCTWTPIYVMRWQMMKLFIVSIT